MLHNRRRPLFLRRWRDGRSVRTAGQLVLDGLLVAVLGLLGDATAVTAATAGGSSSDAAPASVVDVPVPPTAVTLGDVSGWIRLAPSDLVQGELRVTAPPGTTIVGADADVRPLAGSIASDGQTATWSGENSWSSSWRVPKIRVRVDAAATVGRTTGSVGISEPGSGTVLAAGSIPVDVTAPDIGIPVDRTVIAVGGESDWIRVVPEQTVLGVLTITAPPGTRIVAADADTRPIAGSIAPDGSSVTWAGKNTWSPGRRTAKVRLRADDDASSGPVTGTARITESGGTRVLADGRVPVDVAGEIDVEVPAMASGATSGRIPVHVRSDVVGDLRVEVPTGVVVADAGVEGAGPAATVAPDGTAVTWHGDGVSWSDPSRYAWFTLRSVERPNGVRRVGEALVVGATDAVLAHGRFTAVDSGPRPASIEPSADRSRTAVRVYGLGSASTEQAR